jgi:hypothetical protein
VWVEELAMVVDLASEVGIIFFGGLEHDLVNVNVSERF